MAASGKPVKPQLKDINRRLSSVSYKWFEIGTGLDVSINYRESLRAEGPQRTDSSKLEAVINKWLESHCSEVSWNHLLEVLREKDLGDAAEEIEEWLRTDGYAKYHWNGGGASVRPPPTQPAATVPPPNATQQTKPDIYQKEPEHYDIKTLLSSLQMSPKWFEIGQELKVEPSVLESLRKKGEARTDEERLGEVLEEWINSQCSDVTWRMIIEVLKRLRRNKQAQLVDEYLEKEEVIEKYQGEKDFKRFS